MLLSTWIDKNGGTGKTGLLLGLRRNCVYAWRHGRALPRAAVMKAIVKKSGGRVSYSDMVDEYLEKRTRSTKVTTARKKKASKKAAKKTAQIDLGF